MLIDYDVVNDFIIEYCQSVTHKDGKWNCRCPLCGDSKKNPRKKRLNISFNNGTPLYKCFNCNAGGSFIDLYMKIKNISYEEAYKQIFKYDSKNITNKLKSKSNVNKKLTPKTIIYNDILKDCIHDDNKGFIYNKYKKILNKFRKDRKISENIPLYICFNGEYKDRIIIPILDNNGNIIFFQGRAIRKGVEPKYLSPSSEKKHIIYNRNNFKRNKNIIVTEGLIDAFMLDDQGTTCLGSSIDDDFLSELYKLTDENVILLFDNDDAGIKAKLNLMKTSKYRRKLKFFSFPENFKKYKDLNEIIVNENINNISKFVEENSYDIFKTQILEKIKS